MKDKKSLSPIYFALSLLILFIVVASLILLFMRSNQKRIAEQNQQYLSDAASQSLKVVNEIFDNASKSIAMVSRLYEIQLEAPEFDYHLLNDMSEPTPFDYIRFVSLDGKAWSGAGTYIDCLDREYYTEGIKGGSGICYIGTSRFLESPILLFYTPLYYEGEIIGVVNGIIPADRLGGQLQSSYFGVKADSCIILPDSTIVASSWGQGSQPGLFTIPDEYRTGIQEALRTGSSINFRYEGTAGLGNACINTVANGRFLLVQTLPSTVTQSIVTRANQDGLRLEFSLIAVFLIYLLAIALYAFRYNRQVTRQNEDLGQIVDSVKRLYRRFVVFDLDKDSYEYLEQGDISILGLPAKGSYSEWLNAFIAQNEADPRFWSHMDYMDPQHLRETLTPENWYSHRDYPVPGGRWERLSLIRLDSDEHTSRILGAVEDITEAKQKDEASRQALETAFHAAEAASRAKSDFLSRMSHDIRTPMNAIIGLTAILGAHLDDRDRVVDCLTKITSSSKHLLGLINEVLDMSKIESGKLVLSEEEFSLPSLVDDLMDIVLPTANAKHQEFNVSIRGIRHEDVLGDGLRLQQVFVNILSNAVKYTGEGGRISMTLTERPGKQPLLGEYEFVFEDNGIGMTPEFLQRIFNPFERADDERVSTIQGTGLGMSIAQSLIHLMGGTIQVESEPGKGSKFTVNLSLKLQDVDPQSVEQLVGLPVLVADDEQIACETACLMLSELGMLGEWVLTGREAVDRVVDHHRRDQDFFAVILDWKMPGMDGVETARAIRSQVGPDVPIIILSSYDWSEIENEARMAGVNAFIGKPLFKSRLRGVFVNLMSGAGHELDNPLSGISKQDYSGKRALLVEDNALNQEIAQEILEMTGLTVEVAENGKVAVDKYSASPAGYYDIIFMDIQMPIMNGYEATRAIRALDRADAGTVPIVAMTANTFNEDVQASLEAGMDQHIGKPLDMDQLSAALQKWLA